jgi:hypothetical protein
VAPVIPAGLGAPVSLENRPPQTAGFSCCQLPTCPGKALALPFGRPAIAAARPGTAAGHDPGAIYGNEE